MRTWTENKIFKAALILTALMMLSACGANKSFNPGDSDQGSNIPTNAAKAVCSKNFEKDETKIQVSAYYDSNGQYYNNKFRVKLTNLPADTKASDYDMTVRLMAVSSSGSMSQGATVPFNLEFRYGNGYAPVMSQQYPVFGASQEVLFFAKHLNLVPQDTAYADFNPQVLYNTAHLVAHTTDTTGAFQILRVEFRAPTAQGNGAVVKYYDTLLPIFHADPNEYAKTHHATLQNLHPLKAQASQSWTQEQFKAFSDQWCF